MYGSLGQLVSFGGNGGGSWRAIRTFDAQNSVANQNVKENPSVNLNSNRWYGSSTRTLQGDLLIAGGMTAGGYNNKVTFKRRQSNIFQKN